MKLLLLLLFVACTKVSYREVPGGKPPRSAVVAIATPGTFEPEVDLIVAFLWPEQVRTAEDRSMLRDVIGLSRTLKARKEAFQKQRFELREKFRTASCPCVLDQSCRGDEALCLTLEEELYALEAELPEIYALVDEVKEKVRLVGGEWIDSQLEYPELPRSRMDAVSGELTLSFFADEAAVALGRPRAEQNGPYQKLIYTWKGWRLEVAPTIGPASLVMQGELRFGKRQGIIFWEHARATDLP